jgi:hypothetical protein
VSIGLRASSDGAADGCVFEHANSRSTAKNMVNLRMAFPSAFRVAPIAERERY